MFFYYFDMVRPIDQEMTAIEEILYFAHSSKTEEHIVPKGPYGEALGSVMRQTERTVGKRLYCGFCRVGWVKQVGRLRTGYFG